MASEVKTNKISPATASALSIGDSGDTITVPSGATFDISASTLTPPATLPASSGINLTALNASNLGSGTVPTARLGTGTASSSTFLTGAQTYAAAGGGGLAGVIVYTGATTWVKATRETALGVTITKVVVEVQGGGAGGGKSDADSYQIGGGAGGYAKKFIDVSSITSSTIAVGAGGAGATGYGAGVSGGDSSWTDGTNTVTGVKGLGGYGAAGGVAYGGSGTGGDINITGGSGSGASGYRHAGNSFMGTGGLNDIPQTGLGYGSGGGGKYNADAGSGTAGIVIVWEYQ